jgi:hypothetical protein
VYGRLNYVNLIKRFRERKRELSTSKENIIGCAIHVNRVQERTMKEAFGFRILR